MVSWVFGNDFAWLPGSNDYNGAQFEENVNNPDLAIFLPLAVKALSTGTLVDNAGQVVLQGNPTDGWTLVSWDGQKIPQDPGLLTELFVDERALSTAPQIAAWNIFEATVTGNSTTIENALHDGLQSVGAAIAQFPQSVITDIADEVHNLGTDLAAGETFSDAFGSAILGLT